jgi:hypothetical protein
MLLAAGDGLVARGIAFLFLYGANELGFPKPGIIFYPQAAGFVLYMVQRHGKHLLKKIFGIN